MGAKVGWGSGAKLMLVDDTVVFEEGAADEVAALLDAAGTETGEGVGEGVGVGDALVVWSAVVDMSTLKFEVTSSAAPVKGSVPTWTACTNYGRTSLSLCLPQLIYMRNEIYLRLRDTLLVNKILCGSA